MMEPSPEQLISWTQAACLESGSRGEACHVAARLAYAAGADAELEGCLTALVEEILTKDNLFGAGIGSVNSYSWDSFARMVCIQLRAARRKSPSLKQQAITALDDAILRGDCITTSDAIPTIRRAIESLPDP
jgi:hypothetical protein